MLELQQKLHIFGRGGPVTFGLSGIDIALWDIAGKAAGLPVHKLLGGPAAPKLPCYASLIRYTEPKVVATNVERALSQGFGHVKLHEVEIAPARAAREAAGEGVDIMLDVNCPWSLREALDMTEKLRPFNLRWLEEPVWPPENYAGLAQVRASGGIPIAAGENAATLLHYQQMLEARAVDFVQPSPIKMGGVSELRKVFVLAARAQRDGDAAQLLRRARPAGRGACHRGAGPGFADRVAVFRPGGAPLRWPRACRRTVRSMFRKGPDSASIPIRRSSAATAQNDRTARGDRQKSATKHQTPPHARPVNVVAAAGVSFQGPASGRIEKWPEKKEVSRPSQPRRYTSA